MRKILALTGTALMMVACGGNEKAYDATGTFEATETTVFAEQSGALLTFNVNEGDSIGKDQEVGLIDTTQTWLKIQQLGATKQVYQSQKPDMERQIAATRQQLNQSGEGVTETVGCASVNAQLSTLNAQLSTFNGRCPDRTIARHASQMPCHGPHKGYRLGEICGAWRVRDYGKTAVQGG